VAYLAFDSVHHPNESRLHLRSLKCLGLGFQSFAWGRPQRSSGVHKVFARSEEWQSSFFAIVFEVQELIQVVHSDCEELASGCC
jgi:hypothetical protein